MGIQGLIPFLEKATRQVNIRQYSGCCVAVDAYCWLHKGAFSCAEKLARGEKCDAYVYYCMKFVNMLLSHNIKPILVFDGRHLPAKADTESKRRESRENCRTRAAQLLRAGRTDEARNFIRRCVDVTHEMALAVMQECQKRNVDCIVAPYEADAQLAYLNIKNIAQIVITEDSDLVLFGCSRILFKMDVGGNGLLVEQEKLFLTMGIKPQNYSFDKFRHMCILSGCDYLPSLPGVGLVKACKFVKKITEPDIRKALLRLPSYLNLRSVEVTDEYRDSFILAESAFRYQLVFDPVSRKLVHLTPPPENYEHVEFVGKKLPNDVAYQLALGNLDPFTLKRVADFDPDRNTQVQTMNRKTDSWNQKTSVAPHISIWSKEYKKPKPLPSSPDAREVERPPPTKGKSTTVRLKLFSPPKITSNECEEFNDKDIVSMYGEVEEKADKQPCIKDLTDESSPDLGLKRRRNPFAVRSENHKDVPPESSKSIFAAMSPPNSPKKSSPYKENTSPSILDTSYRRKVFSALKNFGKVQQVSNEKTVVKSRYFSKEENISPKQSSPNERKCEESKHSNTSSKKLTVLHNEDDMMPFEDEDDKELARLLGAEYNTDFSKPAEESVPTSPLQTSDKDKMIVQSTTCLTPPVSQPNTGVFKWGTLHSTYSFQSSKVSVGVCSKSKSVRQGFKRPFQSEEDVDDPDELDVIDSKENDAELRSSSLDSGFQSDIQCSGNSSASILEQDSLEEVSSINKLISPPKLMKTCTPLSGKSRLRIGLSKSKKTVEKQQTLLNMFGFQKKPKLVHT